MVFDCADHVVIQSWRCECWAGLTGSWPPKPNLGGSAPHSLGRPLLPATNLPSNNRVIHPWAQTWDTCEDNVETLEFIPWGKEGFEKLVSFEGKTEGLSCAGTRLEQICENKQGVRRLLAKRLYTVLTFLLASWNIKIVSIYHPMLLLKSPMVVRFFLITQFASLPSPKIFLYQILSFQSDCEPNILYKKFTFFWKDITPFSVVSYHAQGWRLGEGTFSKI